MATAIDVITRALQKIKIYSAGEAPTADDADYCLSELNEMLFEWQNDGIDLGHVALELEDTLDVPDDHLQTVRLSLAEKLAGDFGGELSGSDAAAAERGRSALRAIYFNIADLRSDNPLARCNLARDW